MRNRRAFPSGSLCLLVTLAANPVSAEWTGGIEGGTVVRDEGNATRLSLSLVDDSLPLSHALRADWLRYDDGSGYRASYVPRYWLDRALYLFGELEARVDPPLGIDSGYFGVGGVGYRVFDTPRRGLGVEVGAGARRTEFESGAEQSEVLALLRTGFYQRLADTLRLELDAEVLQGETLGELRAEAAATYRVSDAAVRVGYRIRRLSFEDGPTIEDDAPSLSVSYGF